MTTGANFEIPDSPIFDPNDFSQPAKDPVGVGAFFVAGMAALANQELANKGLDLAGNLVPGPAKIGIKALIAGTTALTTVGATAAATGALPAGTELAILGVSTVVGIFNPIAGIIVGAVLTSIATTPPPTAVEGLKRYNELKPGFDKRLDDTGFGDPDEFEKVNNPVAPSRPGYGTAPGEITPGKMKTVDTPAGPKEVKVMKEIDTPAGKKTVWDGSHYNPPGGKGARPTNDHTPGGNPHPGDQHPSSPNGNKSPSGNPGGDRRAGDQHQGSQGSQPHDSKGRTADDPRHSGPRPILLDLDGNGVTVADLSRSTTFKDGGDGLQHRTAWAGAGDGVLFFDPDGRGAITGKRQYVFTEWGERRLGNAPGERFSRRTRGAPGGGAKSDMEALRSYFDSNGDGKLTAADAAFANFKVLVTNADGSTTVMTLAQLGITAINLTEDSTRIELPDGSVIEGRATFPRPNGTTGYGSPQCCAIMA